MDLKHMYKRNKAIRWYKFKKKIRGGLPKYDTETGTRYKWGICIIRRGNTYCPSTGRLNAGYPFLHITQIKPFDNSGYENY